MSESEARIEEIRERLEQATDEEWQYLFQADLLFETATEEAYDLIMHAPSDMSYLLEHISELEKATRRLREKNHQAAIRARHLLETGDMLREESRRLRATLEKMEQHVAEVRRGGECFPESGDVAERRIPPAGSAF